MMDTPHTLFQVLTMEGIPWAQVDEQAQIILAGPQECTALTRGALPLPAETTWPPRFPAEGGPAAFTLRDGSAWLAWPLEDGSFLVVARDYWPRRLEEERAQRPKFISVVTHELRLPLTSIQGYTTLLLKGIAGPVTAQQTQFLEIIRNNVQRMAVLLDRLSDMGKLQSGRLKVRREPVQVWPVVEEVTAKYRPLCAEKGLTLQVEPGGTEALAQADPERLPQVLEALLDNAYRYTPPGGQITLRVRPGEDEVQIWVEDTGIGISPEDQAALFQPFFRSEDEAVREHPGWGLSLHVAALLVEQMGGSIAVESDLGKGSRFVIHLPVAEPQLEQKP